MLKKIILINMLFLCLALLLASPLTQSMEDGIRSSQSEAEALELIRTYAAGTEDMEDLRMLQNYWLLLAPEECLAHFTALKKQHPKSAQYIYLWARATEDPKVQMKTGRQLIKKHPAFEYGYRLLLTHYQKNLFIHPGPDHAAAQPLMKDFKKDRKFFAQYLKKLPDSESAYYLNIALLVWEKKVPEANRLLAQAVDKNMSWLNWQFYLDYYFRTDQILMLETYIRRAVYTSKLTQHMSDAEKEFQTTITYLSVLFEGGAYNLLFDYVKVNPASLQDEYVQKLYLLASVSAGEPDRAFDFLGLLSSQPNNLYGWMMSEEDLEPLRQDIRWQKYIGQFKTAWDINRESRRVEALATKTSKPAPLWELEDVNGNTVRLADLKGSIVILDFWATWCEPCARMMPVLDGWMRNAMPPGVKVYSINVWEREPDKAAAVMAENDFAMTLLYGNDNLSTAYGFEAIPFLCVIDRDGNIRYEERGLVADIGENLTFWVEDLLY
jgi:thiol-disulfide isomerase/thioredoxin